MVSRRRRRSGRSSPIALTPTAYDYDALVGNDLRTDDVVGEQIVVTGRLIDGGGDPVPDAMIEIWQADGEGRYPGVSEALANARFKGFGRSETPDGVFRFLTVKPGRVPGPRGPGPGAAHQCRHLRPRHPEAPVHPHLFRRRGGERGRPGARLSSRPTAAPP